MTLLLGMRSHPKAPSRAMAEILGVLGEGLLICLSSCSVTASACSVDGIRPSTCPRLADPLYYFAFSTQHLAKVPRPQAPKGGSRWAWTMLCFHLCPQ